MAIHVLSSSKRARSIPSLVAHNQCGGPKKAGIAGFQGMGPRDGWRGGRGASHPLNYFFKKCSDIPRSMMTMNKREDQSNNNKCKKVSAIFSLIF